MVRVYLKSLVVGLGAAFVVGAIWVAVGPTRVTSSVSALIAPAPAKPNEAIPAAASDDVHVETTDSIVAMATTVYSDPYVAWVALAAMLCASAWNLRRLRKPRARI